MSVGGRGSIERSVRTVSSRKKNGEMCGEKGDIRSGRSGLTIRSSPGRPRCPRRAVKSRTILLVSFQPNSETVGNPSEKARERRNARSSVHTTRIVRRPAQHKVRTPSISDCTAVEHRQNVVRSGGDVDLPLCFHSQQEMRSVERVQ